MFVKIVRVGARSCVNHLIRGWFRSASCGTSWGVGQLAQRWHMGTMVLANATFHL